MLQLALRNPRIQFAQGRVDSIEYDHSDSDSDTNFTSGRKTQRRQQRRVKGVRCTRTKPGGGGGWTAAPPIPNPEEGVSRFTTESVAAFVNPTNSAHGAQEEDAEGGGGDECFLLADRILISAGPWSRALLDGLPIEGTRSHSITVRPHLKKDLPLPDGESEAGQEGKRYESAGIRVKERERERERMEISLYALFTSIEMPPPPPVRSVPSRPVPSRPVPLRSSHLTLSNPLILLITYHLLTHACYRKIRNRPSRGNARPPSQQ